MRRLEARTGRPSVYEVAAARERVLSNHARLQETLEKGDGYRYGSRCRQALQSVGFHDEDHDLPVDVLSGGQKKMLGPALLAISCDLLLLDEPDSHLDLAGRERLERLINSLPGTVIIVSHDRDLLEETVTQIAELEDRQPTLYQGNYVAHATEKQLGLLREQQCYKAQQKEIRRVEAAIAQFELWASLVVNKRHNRQARSRQKMLDRVDRVEQPVLERETMGLRLNGWRGSDKVLEIRDLTKAFDDVLVLLGLDLLVWRGAACWVAGREWLWQKRALALHLGSGGTYVGLPEAGTQRHRWVLCAGP